MSMWFYDEAGELEEYRLLRAQVKAVEREYLELRTLAREAEGALSAQPDDAYLQAKVHYLGKRLKHLELQYPWLLWDTPLEVALFSPPHG
jgi:hypothetical protein